MAYGILPMTRLGLVPYQHLPTLFQQMNRYLREGKEIYQVDRPITVRTQRFPEGHMLFPGSFFFREEECDFAGCKTDRLTEDELPAEGLQRLHLAERIAFLNGKNCTGFCLDPFMDFFKAYGIKARILEDEDIRGGALQEVDLLIVPGGPDAGESYYEGLGDLGFEEIKTFIAGGGAYLGSCAGSYFPLTAPSGTVIEKAWLNIIPVTDREGLDYWRTGTGFVRVAVEDLTHPVMYGLAMGAPSTLDMIYWEGPAFDCYDPGKVKVIASYKDFIASGLKPPSWDISMNPIAEEAMKWLNPLTEERFEKHLKGKAAIIETEYGNGKLVLFSPHAEFGTCGSSPAMEENANYLLLMNGLYYLSRK